MTWLSRAVVTGAVAAFLLGCWAASYPAGSPRWESATAVVALVTLVAGTVLLVATLRRRVMSVAICVAMLVAGSGIVLVRADVPRLLRFAAARSAFEQVIIDRGEVGPDAPCPSRVGTYAIWSCLTVGSDTFFAVRGTGFIGAAGFTYLPEGPAGTATAGRTLTPLGGPWFAYAESW